MFCTPLPEATSVDRFGGKAANLSKVLAFGVRVPPTVVLAREALRLFLEQNGLQQEVRSYLESFGNEDNLELTARFSALRDALEAGALPPELRRELLDAAGELLASSPYGLAVRSSAVLEDTEKASFAGVYESYVGVLDPSDVVTRVLSCWCSSWSPKALRYLARMGFEPRADGMAVMIQQLLPATCSGVVYTADPASGNPWYFVMHATRGLAVDLMSGSGAGDTFWLDWATGAIEKQEVAAKKILIEATRHGVRRTEAPADANRAAISGHEVVEVANIARQLDEAMQRRLDIEWVITPEGPWVVQARPLAALPEFFPTELPPDQARKTWIPATFTVPLRPDRPAHRRTPLYSDLSESELWFRHQPEDVALTEVWREERDINGFLYVARYAPKNFLDHFDGPAEFEPWLDKNELRYRRRWDRRGAELDELAAAAADAMKDTATAAQLIPVLFSVRDRFWDLVSFGWAAPQAFGWMCEGLLRHFLGQFDPLFRSESIVAGGDGTDSYTFAATRSLQELGRSIRDPAVKEAFAQVSLDQMIAHLAETCPGCEFLASFEGWCWRFGRTPPSWRLRPPFWSGGEGHAQRMHTIKSAMLGTSRDVVEVQRESLRKRNQNEKEAHRILAPQPLEMQRRFDKILGWTRYWTQALNDRHGLSAGWLWEKELIWQIGARLRQEGLIETPEDVLVLRREDLEDVVRLGNARACRDVYLDRKNESRRNDRLRPPAVIGEQEEQQAAESSAAPRTEREPANGNTMKGVGLGAGEATGRARPVTDLHDPGLLDSLSDQDILILPHELAFVYADWHSLLTLVKGVVSPGRPSHHLTQVARECGVPIVAYVDGDLGRIAAGARIHISSESGLVNLQVAE